MAQLRPSILYTLLVIGGVLTGVGLVFGLFYDAEKFEGNRYENSYDEFNSAALTKQQYAAIKLLQNDGVEWAHFRFIEAIKDHNLAQVKAFIDAGMPLNSNSILLEIVLGQSADKKGLLLLLNKHYALDLNALYQLPNFVSTFDMQLDSVSSPYIAKKQKAYRKAVGAYNRALVTWAKALELKEQEMLKQCDNDACRSGRIHDARRLLASSKPVKPEQHYVSKERVHVSLFTVLAWQQDKALINVLQERGVELIPNKLFLTDGKLIRFIVDVEGQHQLVQ